MAAITWDGPISQGMNRELTIAPGGGVGAQARITVTSATHSSAPRATPNAAPASRSSQESPIHRNIFARMRPTSAPAMLNRIRIRKKPSRLATGREFTYGCMCEPITP